MFLERIWFSLSRLPFARARLVALALALAGPAMADDLPVNRCLNIGNVLDAPFEGAWDPPLRAQDLDWIAGAGFDTIRLPVRFGSHWNGRVWPGFMARVEQIVVQAQARGLRVILDLHHFDDLMADPDTYTPVFVAIWTELAERFEGHDDRLIFELLNEPRGAVSTARALDLYEQVLPIIRARHPERWIILGGGDMNSLDEMLRLPDLGPHVALSFHYYAPMAFTHQQQGWTETYFPPRSWGSAQDHATIAADFARVADARMPVILSEFGVVRAAENRSRNDWIETVRRAADAQGIGWCYWAYGAGFDLRDFQGYEWVPGLYRALME